MRTRSSAEALAWIRDSSFEEAQEKLARFAALTKRSATGAATLAPGEIIAEERWWVKIVFDEGGEWWL